MTDAAPTLTTNAAVLAATLELLESHHPAVQTATIRSAAVHWFDEDLLDALVNPAPGAHAGSAEAPDADAEGEPIPSDLLFAAVESLPFMERFGPGRCALHAHVRQVLFHDLHTRDDGVLRRSIEAAAAMLASRLDAAVEADADVVAEYVFAQLAADSTTDDERVGLLESVFDSGTPLATAERALLWVDELDREGMLSEAVTRRLPLWRVRLALAAGSFGRALELGAAASSSAHAEHDAALADEVDYEIAVARSNTGDRDGAQRLVGEIVSRSDDRRMLAQCRAFMGDLTPSAEVATGWYLEALRDLAVVFGLDPEQAEVGAADSWAIAELRDESSETPPEDGSPPIVIVLLDREADTAQVTDPDPMFAELWLRLGEVHMRQGALVGARDWFERAEELFNLLGDGEGRRRAVLQQQDLAGRLGSHAALRDSLDQHRITHDWARATGALQVELETLIDIADTYLRLGDVAAAEDVIRQAEGQAESAGEQEIAARACEVLAEVLVTSGRYDESDGPRARARTTYGADRPTDVVRIDLAEGIRWENAGAPERAADAYERARTGALACEDPELLVWSLLGLTRTAVARRDIAAAQQYLDTAAAFGDAVDPAVNVEVQVQMLNLYAAQGRKDDADAVADALLTESRQRGTLPVVARVQFDQACIASRRGDHDEAVAQARAALELARELQAPTLVFDLVSLLAFELYGDDELHEARAFAEEGLLLASQQDNRAWTRAALHTLAGVLVELRDLEPAIAAYHQALEIDPTDASTLTSLGWAYLRAGDFETSLTWSNRALEANPHDPFPYRNIGHALLGLGRTDEAKGAYLEVIENRLGDETFDNTFREFERLRATLPEYEDIDEMVAWFHQQLA